jgi:hypothetical protein
MRGESGSGNGAATAAELIVERLRSIGLRIETGADGKTAEIRGAIPTAAILEHLSRPGPHVHSVNRVEIYSDRIRVIGREFDEYLIRGTGVPA